VGLELTLAEMFGSAKATLLGSSHETKLDSFVVQPSVALLLEI